MARDRIPKRGKPYKDRETEREERRRRLVSMVPLLNHPIKNCCLPDVEKERLEEEVRQRVQRLQQMREEFAQRRKAEAQEVIQKMAEGRRKKVIDRFKRRKERT